MVILFFSFLIVFNYTKSPNNNDIRRITNDWSPSIEEIYGIKKINGNWLAFFRSEQTVYVGNLERKWNGSWGLIDDNGRTRVLASAPFPPETEDNGITWGAKGVDNIKTAYYFGMISNPNIKEIRIDAQGKVFKGIPFIHLNGFNFFLLKTKGDVTPFTIKALSENGELIEQKNPVN